MQILLMWVYETALSHLQTAEGLEVSVMIPRDPSRRGLPNIWGNTNLFRAHSCMYMCFALTRCQELRISCWAPGADHPPLFSLVKEPRGNHISRWIPSLFICTMLITASRKDQSYLNYPQSLQPPEDSPQRWNNEVKTASTFIFTLLCKWVIFVSIESLLFAGRTHTLQINALGSCCNKEKKIEGY